jgi:hypothetical protein
MEAVRCRIIFWGSRLLIWVNLQIDGKFSYHIPLHRSSLSSVAASTQYVSEVLVQLLYYRCQTGYLKGVPSKVGLDIPPEDSPLVESLDKIPEYLVAAVNDLICHLDRSVMLRVINIPQPSWVACPFLVMVDCLAHK